MAADTNTTSNTSTNTKATSSAPALIQDHREPPRGVIPRHVQMWLMVGIAVVMLLVIWLAGHSQPAATSPTTPRTATAALPPADRIRVYQQQLKDEEARLQHVQAQEAAAVRQVPAVMPAAASSAPTPTVTDTIAEDKRRRDYQSLFADNVVLSRRPPSLGASMAASAGQVPPSPGASAGPQASAETGQRRGAAGTPTATVLPETVAGVAAATPVPTPSVTRGGGALVAPSSTSTAEAVARALSVPVPASSSSAAVRAENPAPGPRLRLLEGTVIETALLNRLDGTFAGPVECLVTTPVYTPDRHVVVIPAGARVLGSAAPVQSRGDARLAVTFHRLLMPDGHWYSLEGFKGLDQAGATGVTDEVNRHYAQVFGASLAIGAISGLAQYGTHGVDATSFGDTYRQSAGASLATSSSQVLDRYLNVLPTITIREGFRIKVYLTNDIELPAYAAAGGIQ